MKKFPYIVFLSTFLLSGICKPELKAQSDSAQHLAFNQIFAAAEQEYGFDQVLVNGVHYEKFYLPIIGHPYHLADSFINGSFVYRGVSYSDLEYKYDLYKQQLLLNYTLDGIQLFFYLPTEFISEFTVENKKFAKASIPGEENEQIYQILGEEHPTKILYAWKKIRSLSYHAVLPSYKFTKDEKSSFILIKNKLLRYKGNGSFVRKFPKQDQKPIKKYMHENNIWVRYSDDEEMLALLSYCNSLNNAAMN